MSVWLQVGRDRFFIQDPIGITHLRADIVAAAQAGGAWVRVPLPNGRETEVLIASGSFVRIDAALDPEPREDEELGRVDISFTDYDRY